MDPRTETDVGIKRQPLPFDVIVTRNQPHKPDQSSSKDDSNDDDEFKEARADFDSEENIASSPKVSLKPNSARASTSTSLRNGNHMINNNNNLKNAALRSFSPTGRRPRQKNAKKHLSWNTDVLQCSGTDIFVKPSQMHNMMTSGQIQQNNFRFVRRRHQEPPNVINDPLLDEELLPPVDDDYEVDMDEDMTVCFPAFDNAKGAANSMMKRFWAYSTRVTNFNELPDWLKDNDYLHNGHRTPIPSMTGCMRSVFAVHTETGNIWSHLLGCVAFIGTAVYFLTRPSHEVQLQEKVVFSPFFFGAIGCLAMSTAFHTMNCHSHQVGKLFSKLDYVGISLLIVGSFIPWLYYGFYCRRDAKVVYTLLITVLGAGSILVSLWDKFGTPKYRPLRAGMFIGTGLSGVIPCIHYLVTDGILSLIKDAGFHWMALMATLYIGGALLYAFRVPERFFPGKCDIWFQSHQIFHVCVIAAAFVHYHGIAGMATGRLSGGSCEEQYPGSTDMGVIPAWNWMDY